MSEVVFKRSEHQRLWEYMATDETISRIRELRSEMTPEAAIDMVKGKCYACAYADKVAQDDEKEGKMVKDFCETYCPLVPEICCNLYREYVTATYRGHWEKLKPLALRIANGEVKPGVIWE